MKKPLYRLSIFLRGRDNYPEIFHDNHTYLDERIDTWVEWKNCGEAGEKFLAVVGHPNDAQKSETTVTIPLEDILYMALTEY